MALTTRALVLQRMGLTDDAASAGALVVGVNTESAGTTTLVKSGTTVTLTRTNGGATAFDISLAAYDTITELATGLHAIAGIAAFPVDSTIGALASSLLVDGTYTTDTAYVDHDASFVVPYSNTAGGSNAAFIDQLITEVDSAIGTYCNRVSSVGAETFSTGSRDEKYDGNNQAVLCVRNPPVTAVSSITLVDSVGNASTVASTAYNYESRSGRFYWNGASNGDLVLDADGFSTGSESFAYGTDRVGWPAGFQNIRIQYTGGYTTIPPALQSIATSMVVDLYMNRRRNRELSAKSAQGISESYRSAEDALDQYRNALAPFVSHVI